MPARKIPKNYRNVTGLIATDKSDEMTAYESRLEHNCQKLITFNLNVIKYEEQPVTIPYIDENGKDRKYTPDILVHYRNDIAPTKTWRPLLGEVKWRSDLFKNWKELKPKIKAGRRYAREQDCDFAVLTNLEINTHYLKNTIFLLVFRDFPINDEDSEILLSALDSLRETDAETLIHSITEDNYRKAELLPTLWKLVANFEIGTNLELPLNMRSRLWSAISYEEISDEGIYGYRAGYARQLRWRALRYYPPFEP
jgi:hypothetical protein